MTQPSAQQSTSTMDRLKIDGMRWRTRMATLHSWFPRSAWKPGGYFSIRDPQSKIRNRIGPPQEAQRRAIGSQANPIASPQDDLAIDRHIVDQRSVAAAVA